MAISFKQFLESAETLEDKLSKLWKEHGRKWKHEYVLDVAENREEDPEGDEAAGNIIDKIVKAGDFKNDRETTETIAQWLMSRLH